jgi:putative transferase (TIGR04331 family)
LIEQKRYLITTEDETTWRLDQPVIFLGEWCRLYSRKHIWQSMNAKVAPPYAVDKVKRDNDDLAIKVLEKKLFPEFYKILNQNFNSNYSKRFWKIILGPWFKEILQLLLNRTNTLKQCLINEKISGTTLYHSDYCSLAIPNLKAANYFFDNKKWNNVLNGRILNLIDNKGIDINFINDKDNKYSYQPFKNANFNSNKSLNIGIKNLFYSVYRKIAEKLVKNNDAFLINTYLDSKQLVKLELTLKQFPQLWKKFEINVDEKPNQLLRKVLTQKFLRNSEDDLENILRTLIFELLPVCYLEAFKELQKIVSNLPWPKSPKFIFTSNSFGSDEIFKIYTAFKTENGSKYYVGQHGIGYFTDRHGYPKPEEETADKFLTWGNNNNKLSKYVPMFIFKTAGKSINFDNKGGLLLIERPYYPRYLPWDEHCQFPSYFEEQKKFVSQLSEGPKQKLIIRLSKSIANEKFNETSRWLDFDRSLRLDDGKTSINRLIAESRLVVHGYDSTGLLETLSQNIPTLAFWQNGFDHLLENVKPDYQKLVDAGIVHFSAKSVTDKINEIWNDIDGWWLQSNVQDSKKIFCDIYAKNPKNPIKLMTSFLKKKN